MTKRAQAVDFIHRKWRSIVAITGVTIAVIGGVILFGDVVYYAESFIRSSLALPEDNAARLDIRTTYSVIIAITFYLLIVMVVIIGFLLKSLSNAPRRLALTKKTLDGMMTAALRIVRHIFPREENPPYVFERIQDTHMVLANGDGTAQSVNEIRASRAPLHFWEIALNVEPVAKGVNFLDEIDFKVKDEDPTTTVAYLPTKNQSHSKHLSIFFLPSIKPEGDKRKIAYKYSWPGMFTKLVSEGEEDFLMSLDSSEPVSTFEYVVYFHPSLARKHTIHCSCLSPSVDGQSLVKIESEENGWPGWRYRVENAPADGFQYHLRFELQAR